MAPCPSTASPDHLDVVAEGEQRPDPLAQDGVVVGEEHADLGHRLAPPWEAGPRGGCASPAPAPSRSSTLPPRISTRSSIPMSPKWRRSACDTLSGSKPRPSSSISMRITPSSSDSWMSTDSAWAWRAMLLMASWQTRKSAVSKAGREAPVQLVELAAHRDAPAGQVALGVPPDGRLEPEVVEHRRAQVEDHPVDLLDGAHRERLGLLEARGEPGLERGERRRRWPSPARPGSGWCRRAARGRCACARPPGPTPPSRRAAPGRPRARAAARWPRPSWAVRSTTRFSSCGVGRGHRADEVGERPAHLLERHGRAAPPRPRRAAGWAGEVAGGDALGGAR